MAKGIYGGVPEALTELWYIASSGTQYIDTGVNASSAINIEISATLGTSSNNRVIGARNSVGKYEIYISTSNIRFFYNATYTDASAITSEATYKLEITNGVQKVGGTTAATDTGTFDLAIPLYLFADNENGTANYFGENIAIAYCKIWNNGTLVRNFVPVKDANNVACMYDKVEQKIYYNQGTGTFSAGGSTGTTYNPGIARKVVKAYGEVSGVARKIVKGYKGVNGVAQQFFPSVTVTQFSSSIVPIGWSGSSTSIFATFTLTDTYGEWSCTCNSAASGTSYVSWKAFDGSTTTYFNPSSSGQSYRIFVYCPPNITIKPTDFMYRIRSAVAGSKIQGRLPGTETWEDLYTTTVNPGTTVTTYTATVSTDKYYDAFCFFADHGSGVNQPRVYEFEITGGWLKDER